MSLSSYTLPLDSGHVVAQMIDQHCIREFRRNGYRFTMWKIAWAYLNGARRFDRLDTNNVRVDSFQLDEEGNLMFQAQEMMAAIERSAGRLSSTDLRPNVLRTGLSLGGIRDRSVGQLILDNTISDEQVERVKTDFCYILTALGCCGIEGHVENSHGLGLCADLEVIHPMEMLPFPGTGFDMTKRRGFVRQRLVPVNRLYDRYGKQFIRAREDKMRWWSRMIGEPLDNREEGIGEYGTTTGDVRWQTAYAAGGGGLSASADSMQSSVAQFRETYLLNADNTVERYIATCGHAVIEDTKDRLEGQYIPCPIGWARFFNTGTFYGAGVFDLLYGYVRQFELLTQWLFNNTRDTDRYGFMVMPQGSFNDRSALREVGKGLRVLQYDPDPVMEQFKPFAVQPYNAGEMPGRTAAFAKQLIQDLNPERDLIKEKGRVDSASGLQFLDEQINTSVATSRQMVVRAFGDVYRSVCAQATGQIVRAPSPIQLSRLDLNLAGVIINPEDNSVSFPANPLPDIKRLTFTVRETSPRSAVGRKQEALQLLQLGVSDPDAFKIFALKEGLDFALWMDEEQAAYESVVRNCLLLYGDGQTPGEIIITPHTSRADFQLRILNGFMSSPVMAVASSDVQDAFRKYRLTLMTWQSAVLPPGVPVPEDQAAQSMFAMSAQQPTPSPGAF